MATSNKLGREVPVYGGTGALGDGSAASERPSSANALEPQQRVLIIGHALFDMMMDSYRRALAPHYTLQLIDPYTIMADLENRLLGPHLGAQVNRVVATMSRLVLSGELALAEPRIRRAAAAFAPDVILTDCVDLLRPALVEELRRICPNAKMIGIFGDASSNIQRGYCFVADYDRLFFKEHDLVDKMRAKLRMKSVFYLPQAFDRQLHRPVELTPEDRRRYGCDIAMYGNGYLYRVASLNLLIGRDVKVWGGGLPRWANDHPTASLFTGQYVAGEEKCRAMLAAKIALNSNHYAEIAGTNKRTFELAGMGAFQLTDTPALADVFEPDVEVARYDSADDLLEKLDHYLAHPDLREQMAQRAYERAHREHTYEHRWVAMLETLGMRPPASFPVQPDGLALRAT
jgi:spore maturation protein CgeB